MKKFLAMLLVAVTALVLLPCCGGGGGDNDGRLTEERFKAGNFTLELCKGSVTCWIYPTTFFNNEPLSMEGEGYVTDSSNNKPTEGTCHIASLIYTVTELTEDGKPSKAILAVDFSDLNSGTDVAEKIANFFGFEPIEGGDDENDPPGFAGRSLKIELDYDAKTWIDLTAEEEANVMHVRYDIINN